MEARKLTLTISEPEAPELDPANRPFRMLNWDDLENLPDPEPLIEGVIDRGTVSLLAGASGSGKSFVALDWALSIASGRPWFGREVEKGRVLYLAAEGAYGMKQRVRSWISAHGRFPIENFILIPDAVQLTDVLSKLYLIYEVKDFDLVIIDTLARTSGGLKENDSTDMGTYTTALYQLRDAAKEAGTTVVAVHHTGYDKSHVRGSTALKSNVDNVLMIEAKKDPHEMFTMRFDKRKDGPPSTGNFSMMLLPEESSCIVVKLDDTEDAEPEVKRTNRDIVLEAVKSGCETQEQIAEKAGISKGTVSKELKALIGAGKVISDGARPARHYAA